MSRGETKYDRYHASPRGQRVARRYRKRTAARIAAKMRRHRRLMKQMREVVEMLREKYPQFRTGPAGLGEGRTAHAAGGGGEAPAHDRLKNAPPPPKIRALRDEAMRMLAEATGEYRSRIKVWRPKGTPPGVFYLKVRGR